MTQRVFEILLVEDSPADLRLLRDALAQGSAQKNIRAVSDGEEAMAYLRRRGPYAHAPRPDLILLDLNLPKRDGLDVLREVKADPDLRSITVVILTTSSSPRDIDLAYDLDANCFIVKPVELDDFYSMVRGLEEFWLQVATLPSMGTSAPATLADSVNKSDNGNNSSARAARNPSAALLWPRRIPLTCRALRLGRLGLRSAWPRCRHRLATQRVRHASHYRA